MTKTTSGVATAAVLALPACSSSTFDNAAPSTPDITSAAPSTSSGSTSSAPSTSSTGAGAEITLTAAGRTNKATLNDTEVAQDFARSLPRTLPWTRNAGIEYISELDKPMTETGPFYTDVQPGDIVYYKPLDSVTIIYEKTSSVPTLKMGEIASDLGVLDRLPDDVQMTISAD